MQVASLDSFVASLSHNSQHQEKVLRMQVDQTQSEETRDTRSGKLAEVHADLEKVRIERDQLLQQVEDATEQNRQQMER